MKKSFLQFLVVLLLIPVISCFKSSNNDKSDPGNNTANNTTNNTTNANNTKSSNKAITEFKFTAEKNSGIGLDILGTIDGTNITVTIPTKADITSLIANFTTTGVAVLVGYNPVSGALIEQDDLTGSLNSYVQQSGITINNFANPISYVVVAEDGTSTAYSVTVIPDPAFCSVTIQDNGSLSGTQTDTVCIEANATVTFSGKVIFSAGSLLKINEGVTLKADTISDTYMIIDRGAKIDAQGTATNPIVFTSNKAVSLRAPQDWGGLVINGYAVINAGLTAQGEGDSGTYGGSDDADNSGTLKYVRIEFAGKTIAATDELNSLALQGVGSGTSLSYIQTHGGGDDGIEPYGGKVDLKYIVSTANVDDQFDGSGGWRGKLQFIALATIDGDEGIEWDNNFTNMDATPRTTVVVSNATVLVGTSAGGSTLFRTGTDVTLTNFYINGNLKGSDASTKIVMNTSVLLEGGVFAGAETNWSGTPTESAPGAGNYTIIGANDGLATMAALAALGQTAFNPVSGNAPVGSAPPADSFFDQTANFVGAVKNSSSNWMANWTSFPAN